MSEKNYMSNEIMNDSQDVSIESEEKESKFKIPEFSKGWKLFFTFLANFITFLLIYKFNKNKSGIQAGRNTGACFFFSGSLCIRCLWLPASL